MSIMWHILAKKKTNLNIMKWPISLSISFGKSRRAARLSHFISIQVSKERYQELAAQMNQDMFCFGCQCCRVTVVDPFLAGSVWKQFGFPVANLILSTHSWIYLLCLACLPILINFKKSVLSKLSFSPHSFNDLWSLKLLFFLLIPV